MKPVLYAAVGVAAYVLYVTNKLASAIFSGIFAAIIYLLWRRWKERQDAAAAARHVEFMARHNELHRQHVAALMRDPASHKKRPDDWVIRRAYILERDGHQCRECGSRRNLHVHHVVPVQIRPNHSSTNLITLCARCHSLQEGHGHGPGLLNAAEAGARARAAKSKGYRLRKGRRDYSCANCGAKILIGSYSYAKDSSHDGRRWVASQRRLCVTCITNSPS